MVDFWYVQFPSKESSLWQTQHHTCRAVGTLAVGNAARIPNCSSVSTQQPNGRIGAFTLISARNWFKIGDESFLERNKKRHLLVWMPMSRYMLKLQQSLGFTETELDFQVQKNLVIFASLWYPISLLIHRNSTPKEQKSWGCNSPWAQRERSNCFSTASKANTGNFLRYLAPPTAETGWTLARNRYYGKILGGFAKKRCGNGEEWKQI